MLMTEFDLTLTCAQASAVKLCSCCLVGAKVTLLRHGLWPSRLPRPCRTCSPRPTRPWPTAGRPRRPFTWRGKLSRRSAGLTTPQWTTVAWVRTPTNKIENYRCKFGLIMSKEHVKLRLIETEDGNPPKINDITLG